MRKLIDRIFPAGSSCWLFGHAWSTGALTAGHKMCCACRTWIDKRGVLRMDSAGHERAASPNTGEAQR